MRQQQGKKVKLYPGIYQLGDGTYRIVATGKDPKTGRKKFVEKLSREKDPSMSLHAAVAWRAHLVEQIQRGGAQGLPMRVHLAELCNSSWITFIVSAHNSERGPERVGALIEKHIIPRWGDYFIELIEIGEINTWLREMELEYSASMVRQMFSPLKRIVSQYRGENGLPPLDWSFIKLPVRPTLHAEENRLSGERVGAALAVVRDEYAFYAPFIFTLSSTGLRYCHAAALMYNKMTAEGVVAVKQMWEDKHSVFCPISERKKAPAFIALEPVTLEIVKDHRRMLMRKEHAGLKTGLLFPSEAGTRPVANDQLNDVWREAQTKAGIEKPVTIHGLRHTFHDIARQMDVADAVVKTMAGRAGSRVEIQTRGEGTHLHYSRGVTVEEMRQASIKVMSVVPVGAPSRDRGRDQASATEGGANVSSQVSSA